MVSCPQQNQFRKSELHIFDLNCATLQHFMNMKEVTFFAFLFFCVLVFSTLFQDTFCGVVTSRTFRPLNKLRPNTDTQKEGANGSLKESKLIQTNHTAKTTEIVGNNDVSDDTKPAENKQKMDVMVCVLTRRSAFETRQVIRETWGSGHNNVVFALGACSKIPPDDRIKYSNIRAKNSSIENRRCTYGIYFIGVPSSYSCSTAT